VLVSRITEIALLADRLVLLAVFLFAGATKAVDREGFCQALREFGVPAPLAGPIAVALPVAELGLAAALIPSVSVWCAAWGVLALLIGFLIAVGIAIIRGKRPDCHCFGQLHSAPVGWFTLLRNGALAGCAGWLVARGQLRLGPDLWAWLASLDAQGRKIALVGACVAGFVFFRLVDRARPQPMEVIEPSAEEDSEEPAPRPAPPARKMPPPAPRSVPPREPERVRKGAMGIGLPTGTPAPEFELPGLTGAMRSLRSLREPGRDVLLIFSNPHCEACRTVAANLMRWIEEIEGAPEVILISRGTTQENLGKLKGFDVSRILLQRESEISELYDANSNPTGVVVGSDGLIKSGLALGGVEIKRLMTMYSKPRSPQADAPAAQS
jgi:peroxiredoxin/uncharacterized membrane protein YphA (DoxX/SURF4 family)